MRLLEVGAGPVRLHQAASLLLDPAGHGELDLGVVGLGDQGPAALPGGNRLATDDLDSVSTGPGTSKY